MAEEFRTVSANIRKEAEEATKHSDVSEQAEQAELDAKLNALRAETRATLFAMASDSSDDE